MGRPLAKLGGGNVARMAAFGLVLLALGSLATAEGLEYGGTGGMWGLFKPDLAGLNGSLTGAGFPALSGELSLRGGYGLGGESPGFGVGGLGFGAREIGADGERGVELEVGFGALLVEYTVPLGERALAGAGLALGGGTAKLILHFRAVGDFDDALSSPSEACLESNFFGVFPYLRGVLSFDWFTLEGWAGWFFSFPGEWRASGVDLGRKARLAGPVFSLGASLGTIWPAEGDGY